MRLHIRDTRESTGALPTHRRRFLCGFVRGWQVTTVLIGAACHHIAFPRQDSEIMQALNNGQTVLQAPHLV